MEAEAPWELFKQVSPFSGTLLILERTSMPSPCWRLGVSQLKLSAGSVTCLLWFGGWISKSLCYTKDAAPGKHSDSWVSYSTCILQTVRRTFVVMCYFWGVQKLKEDKAALKVVTFPWFPVVYLCQDVFLCAGAYSAEETGITALGSVEIS